DCADSDIDRSCEKIYNKIYSHAKDLVATGELIAKKYGIPIVNKRISVTPIAMLVAVSGGDPVKYAKTLDRAAKAVGVNFIGGYSALVQKGFSAGDRELIESIPRALAETDFVCSSVNIGSTKAGINMDAVRMMGGVIKEAAALTSDRQCIGAAKLVVFCNAPEDNPFMAGAFHGVGEPDVVLNVGVSGPGVVRSALTKLPADAPLNEVAELIKKTAFKITRMGQLVGTEASRMLGVPFGIIDLSLAPTPAVGDSVAYILEEIGLEQCGTHGTTAALAMLNDAVKKGGVMASSSVGGLSGAFIPVTEDAGMIAAARTGCLAIEKLEAMTAVCSVGLDMIVVPGETEPETLAAIIADEAAIGMVNSKTTAVRLIPAIGLAEGEELDFGGLLGRGPVMKLHNESSAKMIHRGGRIPAPMQSLKN
ncbi:MAG: PFL family protein, partial [Firmicutes bacterium]|nr:PFL family protein [Bacillota bacterium]